MQPHKPVFFWTGWLCAKWYPLFRFVPALIRWDELWSWKGQAVHKLALISLLCSCLPDVDKAETSFIVFHSDVNNTFSNVQRFLTRSATQRQSWLQHFLSRWTHMLPPHWEELKRRWRRHNPLCCQMPWHSCCRFVGYTCMWMSCSTTYQKGLHWIEVWWYL